MGDLADRNVKNDRLRGMLRQTSNKTAKEWCIFKGCLLIFMIDYILRTNFGGFASSLDKFKFVGHFCFVHFTKLNFYL